MRIFVYEYCTALSRRGASLPDSVRAEGRAMFSAVLDDLNQVAGVEAFGLDEDRCPEEVAFRRLAQASDFSLVIAPEWEDILFSRSRWVEEEGGRLLGPTSEAVRLAGDKLALANHLRRHHLPSPECRQVTSARDLAEWPFPAVLKPRQGAGSLATFLIRSRAESAASLAQVRDEGWRGETIVQPYVAGQSASVAFLTGPGEFVPLPPAAQHISADGRFHYLGGRLPLRDDLAKRAVVLARRALETVHGLRGYVGVDLILGNAADGSQDWILEINPRLTTSYVGLRTLTLANLAEAMVRGATGQQMQELSWRPGCVEFKPDGTVRYSRSA